MQQRREVHELRKSERQKERVIKRRKEKKEKEVWERGSKTRSEGRKHDETRGRTQRAQTSAKVAQFIA